MVLAVHPGSGSLRKNWPVKHWIETGRELAATYPEVRLALITGEAPQPSTSNYFVGNDPGKWLHSVPNFGRVRYTGVYPGIDLVYYGNEGQLEYDFVVAPGASPNPIHIAFQGAERIGIDGHGDLKLPFELQIAQGAGIVAGAQGLGTLGDVQTQACPGRQLGQARK